ncbi:putative nuclease HARBI1 [Panulirus ornatus]|uniref:putative nuclease HARBI1 n=1 Tax=Panulirus ornatus TaxID=150431 RepID=UPI003A8B5C26
MPRHRKERRGVKRRDKQLVRPRRSLSEPNDPFSYLSCKEFLEKFRLSKNAAMTVLDDLSSFGLSDYEYPLHLKLLSTLTFYGTGQSEAAAAMLGVSRTTAKHIISDVSKGICDSLKDRYLRFPDNYGLVKLQKDFYRIGQIGRVVGCVVTMSVPVELWARKDMGVFESSCSDQMIKVLAVCGPMGQITYIVVLNNDVKSDWEILRESILFTLISVGKYKDAVLLTNDTFPKHSRLLRSSDTAATHKDDLIFSHYRTLRQTELMFQKIKTRFPCLTVAMEQICPTNLDVVLACAVLHNVCLRRPTPLPPERKHLFTQKTDQDGP